MKKILNIFVCILCALSFPFLTLILSVYTNSICLKIGLIISFLFGIYIVIKNYRSNAKRINIYILILSLITATYFAIYYSKSVLTGNNFVIIFQYLTRHNFGQALLKNIRLLFCIAAIPALSYIYYYLYGFLINVSKKFYSSLLKIEKKYLLLIFLIGGFLTIILLSLTALFDCPKVNNTVRYDILYTTDSSILSLDNSLDINNLQNDIRQPLYGIFSVPILMPISLLCKVLSFNDINFSIISTIFQLLLLSISTILLSRMMNLKEKKMKLFLAFISMTFPYILFSFVAEQYIFCTFYLITAIYVWYFDHLKINYIYIGAVGTLTTSGIIFPLIGNLKFKKEWFKKVLKCFIVFAIVTIVGGQLFKFVDAPNSISALINGFSGTLTFSAKFNQFSHFISSIFFAPKAYIANDLNYYCYSLLPISSIDILGTCLLVICFISYYLNREEKIAKISILWIIFSFVILAVVGWGTRENCLILYSLYFSWSYIVLIFLFFKKIFPNSKKFEISIIIIIILMILRNIPEFINIINFGLKYYRR